MSTSTQIEQAIALVEKNPGSPEYATVAEHYLEQGRLQDALRVCREGFSVNPAYEKGALAYLAVLRRMDDSRDAGEIFSRAVTHNPRSVKLRLAWSLILSESGQDREAQRFASEVLDLGSASEESRELAVMLGGTQKPKVTSRRRTAEYHSVLPHQIPREEDLPDLSAAVEQPEIPAEMEQPEIPAAVEQPEIPAAVEQPEIPAEMEQPRVESAPPPIPAVAIKRYTKTIQATPPPIPLDEVMPPLSSVKVSVKKKRKEQTVPVLPLPTPALSLTGRGRWTWLWVVGVAVVVGTAAGVMVVFMRKGPASSGATIAAGDSPTLNSAAEPGPATTDTDRSEPQVPGREEKETPGGTGTAPPVTADEPRMAKLRPPPTAEPEARIKEPAPRAAEPAPRAAGHAPGTAGPGSPLHASIEAIRASLKARPDDPDLLLALGEALARAGEQRKAMVPASRALQMLKKSRNKERWARGLVRMATVFKTGDRWAQSRAKDFLYLATTSGKAPAEGFMEFGIMYRMGGDLGQAIWYFKMAIKRSPELYQAHLELARTLGERRVWRGHARKALQQLLDRNPPPDVAARARALQDRIR